MKSIPEKEAELLEQDDFIVGLADYVGENPSTLMAGSGC